MKDVSACLDLIESQAAEIERLSALCDKWNFECDDMREQNINCHNHLIHCDTRISAVLYSDSYSIEKSQKSTNTAFNNQ